MVKKRSFKAHKQRLRKALVQQAETHAQVDAQDIIEFLKATYERTFEYWAGGNDSGYSHQYADPVVQFKVTTQSSSRGVKLSIHSVAIDPDNGQPHDLWYWLDFGTRTIAWGQKRSAVFPIRKHRRTTPGSLDVQPHPGFTGEFASIGSGEQRKGIEPTRWSSLIAQALDEELTKRGGTLAGLKDWSIERWVAKRP